jgi:hypothetical protein
MAKFRNGGGVEMMPFDLRTQAAKKRHIGFVARRASAGMSLEEDRASFIEYAHKLEAEAVQLEAQADAANAQGQRATLG